MQVLRALGKQRFGKAQKHTVKNDPYASLEHFQIDIAASSRQPAAASSPASCTERAIPASLKSYL